MKKGLVSIVTPMYNGAGLVGETIDSVQDQTYPDWEMIIVDDASPDGGAGRSVVDTRAAGDSRIQLTVLEENRGSSGARNEGIRQARGEFLAFLDADDLWDSRFLEKQLAFMKEKQASIVFSSYRRIDEKTRKEVLSPFIVADRVNYRDILKSLPIFPSTALVHTGKIGKFYFNENMGSLRDDYVFWLHILRHHVDYAYGNREVMVSYRLRKDSVTARKARVIRPHWHVLRHVEHLSLVDSVYHFCCWMVISYLKYRK